MSDLIRREDVIATIGVMYERCDTYDITDYRDLMLEAVKVLPSADTDLSEYSDKLWKNAYERGKADRPQGEWIDKGRNLWGCSNCGMEIYSESEQDRNEFHKWCSRCGARMKGADDGSR